MLATTCQYRGGGGPEVNKFEQVSSVGHQMSLAGGEGGGFHVQRGPMSEGRGQGGLYNEVQCMVIWVMIT